MLIPVLKTARAGAKLRWRIHKAIFVIHGFKAKAKTTEALIRDLVYTDDSAIAINSEKDLQDPIDRFAVASKSYGLPISMKKTEILFMLSSRSIREESCVHSDRQSPLSISHAPGVVSLLTTAWKRDNPFLKESLVRESAGTEDKIA